MRLFVPEHASTGDPQAKQKLLSLRLGDETYAVEITKVQEIVQLIPPTRVPNTPPHVRGVINIRGRLVPVVDLRIKFEIPETEAPRRCIVVVQVERDDGKVTLGILADNVPRVHTVTAANIERTPDFGVRVDTKFITGIARVDNEVLIALDIDRVLTEQDIDDVATLEKSIDVEHAHV